MKLIDLYIYSLSDPEPAFLLLRRSIKKIYGGQWRMVGGKVRHGEKSWQAAARELREETGLSPLTFWTVPTINHFYEASTDQIHLIPAFAAEVNREETIMLDDEHTEFRWLTADESDPVIFWPEQKRIISLVNRLLINDQILDEWILSNDQY